tara:strand:+ start:277 stop:567 length:291 start_codon:yes stop_codon:yes gene_type:complete
MSSNKYLAGGAGSGGRIKLVRFDWFNETYYKDQNPIDNNNEKSEKKLNYWTRGGKSTSNDGRHGSKWSTPCPPGYGNGLNCGRCELGFYSSNMFST